MRERDGDEERTRNGRFSLTLAVLRQAQAQVCLQDCGGAEGRITNLTLYPGCVSLLPRGLGTGLLNLFLFV